jgi:hypothetical protein
LVGSYEHLDFKNISHLFHTLDNDHNNPYVSAQHTYALVEQGKISDKVPEGVIIEEMLRLKSSPITVMAVLIWRRMTRASREANPVDPTK